MTCWIACSISRMKLILPGVDRKSTRLNSSHSQISYAVFCLKKKKHLVANAKLMESSRPKPYQLAVTNATAGEVTWNAPTAMHSPSSQQMAGHAESDRPDFSC